jgi:hypothetical protein
VAFAFLPPFIGHRARAEMRAIFCEMLAGDIAAILRRHRAFASTPRCPRA